MAEWVDIPMATQIGERNLGSAAPSYVSDANLTNLELVENPPGTRAPFHVAGVPGWQLLDWQPGGSGSYRGIGFGVMGATTLRGNIFTVRGTDVFRNTTPGGNTWSATLGSMPGTSNCLMVDAGTHVVIVDGTNAVATTTLAVTSCSRSGFNGAAYQDGYTIFTETGSQALYVSSLDDPTTVSALDFTTVDALAGFNVGVMSLGRELFVFKQRSIEHYYNAGGSGFPFVRNAPGAIDAVGAWTDASHLAQTHIQKLGNSIFFLGHDKRAYELSGYRVSVVSTPWVDTLLEGIGNLSGESVTGGAYVYRGIPYYELIGPFGTLRFNAKHRLWHKRTTSATHIASHFRASNPLTDDATVFATSSGGVRRLLDGVSDVSAAGSGTPLSRVMTCPQLYFGGRRAIMHELRLDAGSMTLDADGITLQWSDDGGATYNTGRVGGTAAPGLRWLRLGSFRHRIFRLTIADEVAVQIMGLRALVDVEAA